MNWAAVDGASDALKEVEIPAQLAKLMNQKLISEDADDFAKNIIEPIMPSR